MVIQMLQQEGCRWIQVHSSMPGSARLIARESSSDFPDWRAEVQLVGGVGGFGYLADRTIESVARTIVTGVLPGEVRTHVLYASPGHRFYPINQSFTDAVLEEFSQGCRFWVYAGHGQVTELDRVPASRDGVGVIGGAPPSSRVDQVNRRLRCFLLAIPERWMPGKIQSPSTY